MEIDFWNGHPMLVVGTSSLIAKLSDSRKSMALKLFTAERPNRNEHLKKLSSFVDIARLPCLLDFEYEKHGITVEGAKLPTLKMPWVDGLELSEFVIANGSDPDVLLDLAAQLRDASAGFTRARYEHGSLDVQNILVANGRLVFLGQESSRFKVESFGGAENTGFLSIYLQLVALAFDQSLFERSSELPLLSASKSGSTLPTKILDELASHQTPPIRNLGQQLKAALDNDANSARLEDCPFLIPKGKLIQLPDWIIKTENEVSSEESPDTPSVSVALSPSGDSKNLLEDLATAGEKVSFVSLPAAFTVILITAAIIYLFFRFSLWTKGLVGGVGFTLMLLVDYLVLAFFYDRQPALRTIESNRQHLEERLKALTRMRAEVEAHLAKLKVDRDHVGHRLVSRRESLEADLKAAQDTLKLTAKAHDDALHKLTSDLNFARATLRQREELDAQRMSESAKSLLEQAFAESRQIAEAQESRIQEALKEIQRKHEEAYLASKSLKSAAIMTINESTKEQLSYAGIRTARDITEQAISELTFLPLYRTKALLQWRESVEQEINITAPTLLSPQDRERVVRGVHEEMRKAERKAAKVQDELDKQARLRTMFYRIALERLEEYFAKKSAQLESEHELVLMRNTSRVDRVQKQLTKLSDDLSNEQARQSEFEGPLVGALQVSDTEIRAIKQALRTTSRRHFSDYLVGGDRPSGGKHELA